MGKRNLEEEDFWSWLTPAQALERLEHLPTVAARQGWILRRLHHLQLRAAAKTIVQDDRPDLRFALLAPSDWRAWQPAGDNAFWETGDYAGKATIATGPGEDDYFGAPFQAFDVRFDPAPFDDLERERLTKNSQAWSRLAEAIQPTLSFWEQQLVKGKIPDVAEVIAAAREGRVGVAPSASAFEMHHSPEIEKPPPLPGKPPKVMQRELLDWYKVQFAENPGLTFDQIKERAVAHFRPRPVTRQPLRNVIAEMGHRLSAGNPTIRRK